MSANGREWGAEPPAGATARPASPADREPPGPAPDARPASPLGPSSDPPTLQMIASKGLGGAERWFVRFAQALAERGAPAALAVRRGGGLDGADLGLPVHRLPYLTVWDPWSRAAAADLVRRLKPAIVQTYMGRATRLVRLPGLEPERGRRGTGPVHLARLGGYYALGPYRHAHGWIGNTRGLCDWLVAQGLPAARVYHIYNFAEPARPVGPETVAALRDRLAVPDDAWVLAALGRLVPVKGHADLIAALARLPERIADRPLCLVVVGDGPLEAALRRQADGLGQTRRIRWTGWQPDPRPYLQMADLIVFPSLDAETLGNVILEAWAWRRPLVATAFRGARELIRHGEDGWCTPAADPPALAAGIARVLEDPALAAEMTGRGAERIEREFSQDAIVARYLTLYRDLTG